MTQELDLFFRTLFEWCLDLGPALLIGLLLSGLLFAFIGDFQNGLFSKLLSVPEETRAKSFLNSIKMALIGIPLPLCSCSVLPVAQTLRKKGLGHSPISAFLTTTPETSPTSFFLTWAMLGPAMAVLRPVASLIMGLTTALVLIFYGGTSGKTVDSAMPIDCCRGHCNQTDLANPQSSWQEKFKKGFRFAFIDVLDDFGYWPLLGLILGAAIAVWVPMGALENASGFLGRLGIIIVAIPIYVCAESSTPLAPGLLAKGLSPGAVFLFLVAGPLSNLSSLLSLKKAFGTRFITIHTGVNTLIALVLSYLVDMLYKYFDWTLLANQTMQHGDHHERSTFFLIVGVIGTGLLLHSSFRAVKKKFSKQHKNSDACCSG
ncbi:MAG: permease [Bdellovibrio sp.]|nr:permease [Bdellovibrio sp.]